MSTTAAAIRKRRLKSTSSIDQMIAPLTDDQQMCIRAVKSGHVRTVAEAQQLLDFIRGSHWEQPLAPLYLALQMRVCGSANGRNYILNRYVLTSEGKDRRDMVERAYLDLLPLDSTAC